MILSGPVLGVALALLASIGWAGLDAARKVLVRDIDPLPLVVHLTLLPLPLFVAWAIVDARYILDAGAYALPALTSIGLNVAANLLFMHAMRVSPLSLTIPLLAFVPVFTVAVANPLLGELPSTLQLVGIGIVVVGALVLGVDEAETRGPVGLARAVLREPGSLPMLGVALSWSLTIAVDKQAMIYASPPMHGAVLNAGIGFLLVGWLAVRRDLGRLGQARRAPRALAFAVVVGAAALGLQLVAMQYLLVAVLEAIKRALGLVLSIIVGRLMFGEPITTAKVLAVVFMAAGAAAILLDL